MTDRRRRLIRHNLVVGLSLLAHGAVLGWLAYSASVNLLEEEPASPLLSVELVRPGRVGSRPRSSPARPSSTTGRMQGWQTAIGDGVKSFPSSPSTVSGLEASTGPESGDVFGPDKLRAALRAGAGCSGLNNRSLSQEEREKCQESLGRLALSSPSYDAPIDPAKRAYFDEVAAAGPSGSVFHGDAPSGGTPGSAHVTIFKCSVLFGVGQKPKDGQGVIRLGRTPCAVPLQGSFFTPEATVRKR